MIDIREELGWIGAFTREDAPEAKYRVGARIEKTVNEKGDAHWTGAKGTVLGSVYYPEGGAAYFVEWDTGPHRAVFVVEWKIGPAP